MTAPTFDAAQSIQFDLGRGNVRSANEEECVVLVPANALARLAAAASPSATEALGVALGSAIGRRARARLQDVTNATIEGVVTQLAGEAALAGVGSLSLERWGRALVVVVDGSPLPQSLLAPLVAAALEAMFGRRAWCTLLSHEGESVRVLVASESGVERVQGWLDSGVAWGSALARLQGAPA